MLALNVNIGIKKQNVVKKMTVWGQVKHGFFKIAVKRKKRKKKFIETKRNGRKKLQKIKEKGIVEKFRKKAKKKNS